MSKVYHLDLDEKRIQGAEFAFLPGDPKRVSYIATQFDPEAKEIASNREFRTFLGELNGTSVLVTSTGLEGR